MDNRTKENCMDQKRLDKLASVGKIFKPSSSRHEKEPMWVKDIKETINLLVEEEKKYTIEDKGDRMEYPSGMKRDTAEGKPRFDLILPEGIPYKEQMLTRLAKLLQQGAKKYSDRNWEKANGKEEMDRMKASAFRHFMKWMCDYEDGEDHAAAIMFNVIAYETTKFKIGDK